MPLLLSRRHGIIWMTGLYAGESSLDSEICIARSVSPGAERRAVRVPYHYGPSLNTSMVASRRTGNWCQQIVF